jgi:hypothetical protein
MKDISYSQIKYALRSKGYLFFGPTAYDLNVIGIRNPSQRPGKFDDTFCIAYVDANGYERVYACPFTADPGLHYLQHPINSKGCAILKPGQYRGAYQIGLHRGYTALRQIKPVTVFRDADKDSNLDWDNVRTDTGMHAINIHRTLADGIAATVQRFSAGCQVIQSSDDFAYVLSLVRRQKKSIDTDIITYTLIMETDL